MMHRDTHGIGLIIALEGVTMFAANGGCKMIKNMSTICAHGVSAF